MMEMLLEFVNHNANGTTYLYKAKHQASSKAGAVVQLQTGAWHTHLQHTADAMIKFTYSTQPTGRTKRNPRAALASTVLVIWVDPATWTASQGCRERKMISPMDSGTSRLLLCQHLPILLQIHPHDLKHQPHEDSHEPLQVMMVNGHQPLQHLFVAVSHAEPGSENKLVTQSHLLLWHPSVADSV